MAKYDPAYRHDRAGRLVDAQAFEPLEFDTSCFAPKFLAEFKQAPAARFGLKMKV
ncbi:MAG: bifunctional isocitrate dehydrogenase kinase/phosphatase [Desulfobacterales bacterium]|jgi:isocitrate dehydrogenase kinase/phosphatase